MMQDDKYPDYYYFILPHVFDCELDEGRTDSAGNTARSPLKWWLACASFKMTGSPNFLPLAFNIGIMPMTYLVATTITRDRMAGLVSLIVLINLPLYRDWYTSGTYDMVWAFFTLASVLFLYKSHGKTGTILFGISTLFKSMTLMYIPAWLYTAKKNRQTSALIITGIVIGVGALWVVYQGNIEWFVGNSVGFYPENIEDALVSNLTVLWQVIPFMMALGGIYVTFKAKNQPKGIRDVTVWIVWILITTPLIHIFTQQDTYAYRFVVFGVFLSIFASQVVINIGNWYTELQLRKQAQIL